MTDLATALRDHAGGTVVEVWGVPGASRTELTGLHDGALRIRVAAPAAGGKANHELRTVVGKLFGVRRVELLSGFSARRKRFQVPGIDAAEAARRLGD